MQRLTQLLKGRNSTKPKKIELPQGFAEEVLNIEVQLEQQSKIDIRKVNRLIELYSIAVEYYESMKNSKYQVFKNKITRLLLLPTVSQTMQQAVGQVVVDDKKQNQRRNQMENNLMFAVQRAETDVKYILKNANERNQAVNKLINGVIEAQNSKIRSRIGRRKNNKKESVEVQPTKLSHNTSWQQYLMTPQQIQKWKDRVKNKKRRKVLTVKKNMTAQSLPSEYAIPF